MVNFHLARKITWNLVSFPEIQARFSVKFPARTTWIISLLPIPKWPSDQVKNLHPRIYKPFIADQHWNQCFQYQYIIRMQALAAFWDNYPASIVMSDTRHTIKFTLNLMKFHAGFTQFCGKYRFLALEIDENYYQFYVTDLFCHQPKIKMGGGGVEQIVHLVRPRKHTRVLAIFGANLFGLCFKCNDFLPSLIG